MGWNPSERFGQIYNHCILIKHFLQRCQYYFFYTTKYAGPKQIQWPWSSFCAVISEYAGGGTVALFWEADGWQ